jgi:hypothetical protein
VSPSVFKTGQALPLDFTRFLRPRISRGEYPKRPRDIDHSWPRARQIREPEQSPIRMHTHPIRVCEQSMSALSPRPQSQSPTGRIREHIAVSTLRRQALTAATHCPRTVPSPGLATSPNSSRTRFLRELRPAKNCPRRRLFVSMQSPARFQVRIRIIPSYVLI